MSGSYFDAASRLLDNGYLPIPIIPGGKRPAVQAWTEKTFDKAFFRSWRQEDCGFGLVCGAGEYPLGILDTDVLPSEDLALKIRSRQLEICPQLRSSWLRYGHKPKYAIAFRYVGEVPGKQVSKRYAIGGDQVRLEVLGAGCQVLVRGIHPDTKKPYTFAPVDHDQEELDDLLGVESEAKTPFTFPASELPVLTEEEIEKLISAFESIVEDEGGIETSNGGSRADTPDDDSMLIPSYPPLGVSIDEVREWWSKADWDVDDRDSWLRMLCMLKHESGSGLYPEDEWLALADEFSSQAKNGSYKGYDDVKRTWDSLTHNDDPRSLTIRALRRKYQQKVQSAVMGNADSPTLAGLAARLYLALGDMLCFNVDRKSDQWMFNDGVYWVYSDQPTVGKGIGPKVNIGSFLRSKIFPFLQNKAKKWDADNPMDAAFTKEGVRRRTESGKLIQDINPWRKLLLRFENTTNLLTNFSQDYLAAYDLLRVHTNQFDRVENGHGYFPAKNGIVDARTGEFVRPDPSLYISKHSEVVYDPEAKCPLWRKCVLEWMSGDEDMARYLKRLVGLIFSGETSLHLFHIFIGSGRNGKSLFLNVLSQLFGPMHQVASMNTLVSLGPNKTGNSPGGTREDLMKLIASRLVTASEIPRGATLRDEDIKGMTGRDRLTARSLYGKYVDFTPSWYLIVATNNMPVILDISPAMIQRLRIVDFREEFTEENGRLDVTLPEKLSAELPGILNWALEGAKEVFELGPSAALRCPKRMRSALSEFREENDHLKKFFEATLRPLQEGEKVETSARLISTLYARWRRYASDNGVTDLYESPRGLCADLRRRFGIKTKRYGTGYKLLNFVIRTDTVDEGEDDDEDFWDAA